MVLSNGLISQFVKSTKDEVKETKETTVYGTTVKYGSKFYVKIDGSDLLTPVISTTELKPAERVTVLIKNHTATVMGNITAPAASVDTTNGIITDVAAIHAKIGNFELVIADKVSTGELEAKLAVIDEALIGKASIGDLSALNAYIKNLKVEELKVQVANIDKAIIDKADIADLNATIANIESLTATVAKINTLVGGNLTMDNIQSLVLTSSKVTVDNAFIKDAMIDRVSATKLDAGTVNTNLVNLKSDSGNFILKDNTIQISDDTKVRVQIGKDATGDYSMSVWDMSGKLMFDSRGIKADAIKDEIIRNDMISQNANISGDKLNINSVINKVNEDGTNNLLASKILFNGTEQTLDVGFNQLKTKTDENTSKTESLSTDLKVQQGQIQTAITNTQIIKDGQTVLMKDEFSKLEQTVGGMKSDINSHTSKIDANTGAIQTVETNQSKLEQTLTGLSSTVSQNTTKINETDTRLESVSTKQTALEQNLDGFKTTVSSTYSTKDQLNGVANNVSAAVERITTAESGITQLNNKIGLKVEQKDIDTAIVTVDTKITAVDTKATTAKSTADTAKSTADTAKSTADTAKTTATTAQNTANTANTNANAAKDVANTANTNANAAKAEVTTVKESVAAIDLELDGITQRVASNESTTTTLTNQMGQVDGKINTAKNQAISDARGIKDTRTTNESPGWYMTNYPKQTISEFKSANVIKIPGVSTTLYGVVTTNTPWNDSSGGYPIQTFRSSQKSTYERTGKTNDTWGEWKEVEDTSGSQSKANAALDAAKTYTNTEVTKTNNKVTSLETNLEGITQRVSSTESTTTTLTTKVDTAQNTANTANTNANAAKSTADTAKSTADTAKSTADTANTNANAAKSTATTAQNTANAANSTATTAKSTADTAKSTADTAKSTADTANGKIDSLEIGGRNLARKSNEFNAGECGTGITSSLESDGTLKIVATTPNQNWVRGWNKNVDGIETNLKEGDSFTISFLIKSSDSTAIPTIYIKPGMGYYKMKGIMSTEYSIVYYTGVWKDAENINLHIGFQSAVGTYYIKNWKLEKGNKPTDWTPAPEDLESKITSVETIAKDASSKLTADGLTTIIGKRYTSSTDVNGIVESKGYQTESQVQQTVNNLQIRIEEAGGFNLVNNSAYKNGTTYWAALRWSTEAGGTNSIGIAERGTSSALLNQNILYGYVTGIPSTTPVNTPLRAGFDSDTFPVEAGQDYTLCCLLACHRAYGVAIEMLCYDSSGNRITGNNVAYITEANKYKGGNDRDNWKKVKHTFKTPTGAVKCHIRCFMNEWTGEGNSAYVYMGEPMVVKGTKEYVWTPSADEMYAGISTFDKNGLTIDMQEGEGSQGKTTISYQGLEIFDSKGKTKAWFGSGDSASIKELSVEGRIQNDYLVCYNGGRPTNLYVAPTATGDGTGRDVNNKSNSINAALSWVKQNYGSYSMRQDLFIYVANGTYYEEVYIGGWIGTGTIQLIIEPNATLYGTIIVEENVCPVMLNGSKSSWDANNGCILQPGDTAIIVRNSYCVVNNFRSRPNYYPNYGGTFVKLQHGARVMINNCDIVKYWHMTHGGDTSRVQFGDNRGDVKYISQSSGCVNFFMPATYRPIMDAGGIVGAWACEVNWLDGTQFNSVWCPKESPPPPPQPTYQWFERTFGLYNLRTVPEGSGSGTSARNGEWGQGKWGSYKPHRGYADMGDEPASWCRGARNFTVWLTVRRSSSSHGYGGAVPRPRIRRPDGSFWDCGVGVARGETITVQLPAEIANAIVNGSMKTLQMWADYSTNDYSFYDVSSIKVRCEKQV